MIGAASVRTMKCDQCARSFKTPILLRAHDCAHRPRGLVRIDCDAAAAVTTIVSPLCKRVKGKTGLEASDAQTDLVSERVANPEIIVSPLANESSTNTEKQQQHPFEAVGVRWTQGELVLFGSGEIAEMCSTLFNVQQQMLCCASKKKRALLTKKQRVMDEVIESSVSGMRKREANLR